MSHFTFLYDKDKRAFGLVNSRWAFCDARYFVQHFVNVAWNCPIRKCSMDLSIVCAHQLVTSQSLNKCVALFNSKQIQKSTFITYTKACCFFCKNKFNLLNFSFFNFYYTFNTYYIKKKTINLLLQSKASTKICSTLTNIQKNELFV